MSSKNLNLSAGNLGQRALCVVGLVVAVVSCNLAALPTFQEVYGVFTPLPLPIVVEEDIDFLAAQGRPRRSTHQKRGWESKKKAGRRRKSTRSRRRTFRRKRTTARPYSRLSKEERRAFRKTGRKGTRRWRRHQSRRRTVTCRSVPEINLGTPSDDVGCIAPFGLTQADRIPKSLDGVDSYRHQLPIAIMEFWRLRGAKSEANLTVLLKQAEILQKTLENVRFRNKPDHDRAIFWTALNSGLRAAVEIGGAELPGHVEIPDLPAGADTVALLEYALLKNTKNDDDLEGLVQTVIGFELCRFSVATNKLLYELPDEKLKAAEEHAKEVAERICNEWKLPDFGIPDFDAIERTVDAYFADHPCTNRTNRDIITGLALHIYPIERSFRRNKQTVFTCAEHLASDIHRRNCLPVVLRWKLLLLRVWSVGLLRKGVQTVHNFE